LQPVYQAASAKESTLDWTVCAYLKQIVITESMQLK
jgi:hypothetical protein